MRHREKDRDKESEVGREERRENRLFCDAGSELLCSQEFCFCAQIVFVMRLTEHRKMPLIRWFPSVIVILIQSASSSSLSSVNIILIINILIIIVVIISSIHSIFGATTTIFYNAVFMMTKVDGGSKFGEMTAVDNEV